jgi:hypothetical protein
MPFLIIREYGLQSSYSPYQIDEIVRKFSMNRRYAYIAYAILSSEQDYDASLRSKKKKYRYSEIRKQIADHYFQGNTGFSICDLLLKSHYRIGAIVKTTPFPAEWKADASYWDCVDMCKKNCGFNLSKY